MKITITPETDAEKSSMPGDATIFEGVERHILIMPEKFHMTGAIDVLRSDVDRIGHHFDKMQTVGAVIQALKQMSVASQIANGPAAQIGHRIIQTGRG